MKKKIAVALAVISGVYLFVPEPTDVIPVIGWLDEGVALAILAWSLKSLGVTPASVMARLRGKPQRVLAPALSASDRVVLADDVEDELDAQFRELARAHAPRARRR